MIFPANKSGHSTPATKLALEIQRARAQLVKEWINEGVSEEEIIKRLLVDEPLAKSFLWYGKEFG